MKESPSRCVAPVLHQDGDPSDGLPAHHFQAIKGVLVLAAVLLYTLKLQMRQRFA